MRGPQQPGPPADVFWWTRLVRPVVRPWWYLPRQSRSPAPALPVRSPRHDPGRSVPDAAAEPQRAPFEAGETATALCETGAKTTTSEPLHIESTDMSWLFYLLSRDRRATPEASWHASP